MTVIVGLIAKLTSAATVLELEKFAVPEGMIEQVETIVSLCPLPNTVVVDPELLKDTGIEPEMTAEFATHPETEMLHLSPVRTPGVTPLTVSPVAAMLILPSHTMVKGLPAALQVLTWPSVSFVMDCGAAVVGLPEAALLDAVPTPEVLVHESVTLVLPVVTVTNVGLVVAVPVVLPPGLTVTLASANPATDIDTANSAANSTTRPMTARMPSLPTADRILCCATVSGQRCSSHSQLADVLPSGMRLRISGAEAPPLTHSGTREARSETGLRERPH